MDFFSSGSERYMNDSDGDLINNSYEELLESELRRSNKSDDHNTPFRRYYGGKGRFLSGKCPQVNHQEVIEDNNNEYPEEFNKENKKYQDHNSCENNEEHLTGPQKSNYNDKKINKSNQENNTNTNNNKNQDNKETIQNHKEKIIKKKQSRKETLNEIDMMAEEFNENARMSALLKEVDGNVDIDQNNSNNQNSIDILNVLSRAEFEEDVIGRLKKFSQLKDNYKYENKFENFKKTQLTNKLAFLNFQNNHRSEMLFEKVKDIHKRLCILRENIESQLEQQQNNHKIKENNKNDDNYETQSNDNNDNFWKSIKNEYECLLVETFMTGYNLGHDDDHKSLIKSQWRKKNAHDKEIIWRRSGGKREYKFQNEQKKCELVKTLLNKSDQLNNKEKELKD